MCLSYCVTTLPTGPGFAFYDESPKEVTFGALDQKLSWFICIFLGVIEV